MDEFSQLYELYFEQIYRYLYAKTKDAMVAEELVQETFYQAFKSLHKFKGNSKIATWLYGIAKNVYLKALSKQGKYQFSLGIDDTGMVSTDTPEGILGDKESTIKLLKAIRKLKEPYKEIMMFRIYGDLSFKDIGEIFDKSENWARVTFYRGKIKLQEGLKDNE